jgi:hypothetical protein
VLALADDGGTDRVLAAWREQGLHCFDASVPGSASSDAPGGMVS